MEFKYIYKLSEAIKAKEQGGIFNRLFVVLARKSLRKRLKTLKRSEVSKEEFEYFTREILNL